jgi:hypothetical protein
MIKAIAEVIKEGIQYLTLLQKTRPQRRMKAAIEAAEKYIFVNDRIGEYKNIDKERQEQLLTHYSKRFFHYN